MTNKERHELKLSLRSQLKDLSKKLELLPDEVLVHLTSDLTELKTKVQREAVKALESSLD